MQPKTSNFQLILLIVCAFFAFGAILVFATGKNRVSDTALTPVVAWGTLSSDVFTRLVNAQLEASKDSLNISYVQKEPATFTQELVEAIADGNGPDIILLSQDEILENKNRVLTIPYENFPLRTYKDTFIDIATLYTTSEGILAIPLIVDPMVMYWNKTHFVNESLANPPLYWDEFASIVPKLTKKDTNFNVSQSAVALGDISNVLHAKDILSTLIMQAGSPIVTKNRDGVLVGVLSAIDEKGVRTGESALTFFTDFANPTKEVYSWNKSSPLSRDAFLAGKLSIYFGYGSELEQISLKNPNLNFDVASMPQVRNTSRQVVFGKVLGMAIIKSSKNISSAYRQIITLTGKPAITSLVSITNLPPVRRDVVAETPSDPYMKVLYNSALRSYAWLDPHRQKTDTLFREMVQSVIIGKSRPADAVQQADKELFQLLLDVGK